MIKKTVAIINFNTPELTEAAILSLKKHGGGEYRVVVFDNSAPSTDRKTGEVFPARPFKVSGKMLGAVEVIDNTKGQVIDFDKELAKYPNKNAVIGCAKCNEWGSVKHMMTVQKLWELLPDGFVLMESDVLIKRSIDEFFNEGWSVYGYHQKHQPDNYYQIGRMLPMLCWLNVPMFRREGVNYFDPNRAFGLKPNYKDRTNWYDTGASLLEDIIKHRPRLRGWHVDIRNFLEHYGSASWKRNDVQSHRDWLNSHRDLWEPSPQMRGEKKVAVCAIGRLENRYAMEWVEHYKKLGVSKLFIYDNYFGNETPLAETLKDYVQTGLVEITDYHDRQKAQCRAYEDCYKKHGNEYAWIGFFDFDEYLRYDGKKKLPTLLQAYPTGNVLMVNWRVMTDSGLTHYDPRPLRERFNVPMELDRKVKDTMPENCYAKCFVRGGLGEIHFGNNPHCPEDVPDFINTRGEKVKRCAVTEGYDHSVMRLDHYWTKTAEEWCDKIKRGFCSGHTSDADTPHNAERYFFTVNERTAEKEAILKTMVNPQP